MGQSQVGTGQAYLDDEALTRFHESPLDVFIMLARYKFAGRHLKRGDRVLDAGCGIGMGAVMLSQFAGEVVGVDNDPRRVEICKNTHSVVKNLDFAVGDLFTLPADIGQFSAVVSMDVIEHFEEEDGPKIVSSLASVLEDGGLLIIGTPNANSAPYAGPRRKARHPYEYTHDKLREVLEPEFSNVAMYAMTDEQVSTGFLPLAWYLMAVCVK